jgi:hypothetical protein
MINIGWIIDNKYRELNRLYAFKKKLKKKNIKLVLLNKNNFQLGIKSYLFSTIIIPNAWSFGLKIIDIAKKLQVPNICIYHTESFEISNTYLESKYPLNELHNVDFIFSHNKKECDYLEQNHYSKFKFIGHYKYFNKNFTNYKKKTIYNNQKIIGITSTNKYLANPHSSSLLYIINRRSNDDFVKDYLKYEIDYFFFLTRFSKFCKKNNYKIIFRPHPLEEKDKFIFLQNDHFEVDHSLCISKFFEKIDVLLNHISSSSYDAVMNNIPVINIGNFFENLKNFKELYAFPPATIGKKVETIGEIKSILDNENNLLKLQEDNSKIRDEIYKENFKDFTDPLDLLEQFLLRQSVSRKKNINTILFRVVFFIRQILTNFKKNKHGVYNLFNFSDNKLLKKMSNE